MAAQRDRLPTAILKWIAHSAHMRYRAGQAAHFSVMGGESLRGCFGSQEVVGANSRVILTLLAKVSPTGEDSSHLSAR